MANPAGVLFGLDISHHQGDRPQSWWNQVYAAGIRFVILKATEGGSFTDARFAQNLARAEAAGLIVLAYAYQRADASARAHGDRVRAVVPKRIPVIPDIEKGAGNLNHTRAIIADLVNGGHKVPLVYLPRWYWLQIGSPSLHGLPPNWLSRYPDNQVDDLVAEYHDVPAHYWNPIGSDAAGWLATVLLQFTSSARVAGYSPLDGNAFRGSLNDFLALIGGAQATPEPEDEDDMIGYHQSVTPVGGTDAYRKVVEFPFEINPDSAHAKRGFASVSAGYGEFQVRAWGALNGELVPLAEETTSGQKVRLSSFNVPENHAYTWRLPEKLSKITFDVIRLTNETGDAPQPEIGFSVWGDHKA